VGEGDVNDKKGNVNKVFKVFKGEGDINNVFKKG